MLDLQHIGNNIVDLARDAHSGRSILVAISGIDGAGKGYFTAELAKTLHANCTRVAVINVDGWLNLPNIRFDCANRAEHFYLYAVRFEQMFADLVLPLRDWRSIRYEAQHTEETANEYRTRVYEFENIDVILLEGIFLLKNSFKSYYDLSIWIDCSFGTALERAMTRGQEGLSREDTWRAYRTIYFPAQEIHFRRDNPIAAATVIFNNDAQNSSPLSPS